MKHNFSYRYKNVLVRPLEQRDIEYLREWRNDDQNSLYLSRIGYISTEQQYQWYEKYVEEKGEIGFAVDEIDSSQKIVGSAFLYNFNHESVEFGRFLIGDNDAHGKQIGKNALIAILNIAFKELNADKVMLHCFEENKRALYIYKQVGFSIMAENKSRASVEYTMEISRIEFGGKHDA